MEMIKGPVRCNRLTDVNIILYSVCPEFLKVAGIGLLQYMLLRFEVVVHSSIDHLHGGFQCLPVLMYSAVATMDQLYIIFYDRAGGRLLVGQMPQVGYRSFCQEEIKIGLFRWVQLLLGQDLLPFLTVEDGFFHQRRAVMLLQA